MTRIAFSLVFECENLGVSVMGFERGGFRVWLAAAMPISGIVTAEVMVVGDIAGSGGGRVLVGPSKVRRRGVVKWLRYHRRCRSEPPHVTEELGEH